MPSRKHAARKPAAAPSPPDSAARVAACQQAIEAALKRYNCRLEAQVVIQGKAVDSRVALLAVDQPA